jgi:hypothetical protein
MILNSQKQNRYNLRSAIEFNIKPQYEIAKDSLFDYFLEKGEGVIDCVEISESGKIIFNPNEGLSSEGHQKEVYVYNAQTGYFNQEIGILERISNLAFGVDNLK